AAEQMGYLGLARGGRHRAGGCVDQGRKMRLRVARKNTGQPRRVGADEVEQVGRELGNAEQDLLRVRAIEQRVNGSRLSWLELGKPVAKALFGFFGSGDMRALDEASGEWMSLRVSRRGCVHATFCGTSCVCAASLSPPARAGSASVATRPGCASP